MSAIARWWQSVVDWFKSLFWKQEMELTLVGLQNSGKTTLVTLLSVCGSSESKITQNRKEQRRVTLMPLAG